MPDLSEPIPAATLIVVRPKFDGAPEILMMERTTTMAFAAGALVFPGGRIDPPDMEHAKKFDFIDAAARIAAIRETIEETGIATAILPYPDETTIAAIRNELVKGEPFSDLLQAYELSLDLDALTPFAHWCPDFNNMRRFDTLFYIAEAPIYGSEAYAHSAEATRVLWATADAILEDINSGRAHAIFPTMRNLERLACFTSIEEALTDARRYPVQKITPWVEDRNGSQWICIPEGMGYPVTAKPLETAQRR